MGKSQKSIEQKKRHKMYILHDLIYMEYKIKQSKSMALDARRVVTPSGTYQLEEAQREPLGC